ncbi:MAG: YafY family transcriptional regulator [Clostridia bacterium]|nr:YafY family transcriptional regulator [Clostridia bacterium]
MKYQVMVKMLMLLLSRRKVTAKEIADRYSISTRSVYRYVEELNVSGIPIDVVRGRFGGLCIADTFKLPVGYFTKAEYDAAIQAVKAMLMQVNDENTASVLEKLTRQMKNERRDTPVCGNIIVDGSAWCEGKRFSEKMQLCERAVDEGLRLDIDYISRGGEHTRRIIDPHVLIFKSNVWYVYAFCHTKQSFRTFKIGRIKEISYTGETFVKKQFKREDIPLDFSDTVSKKTRVTLKIDPENLPDVEEWLGVDAVEPRGKHLYAEIDIPDNEALVNKILSFGGSVKVVAPTELKEKVKKAAKNIYDNL